MQLSLAEAATILGKSQRQVRYLIKTGRLEAAKEGGRWVLDSAALPLTQAQREALASRLETARRAFDKALAPGTKAAEAAGPRKPYSVTHLEAFTAGEAIYRSLAQELGPEEPGRRHLSEALILLSRGCHSFHPAEKADLFGRARDSAATAVADLLLESEPADEARRGFARRIEEELIPKIAGLIAMHERRSRRRRFDRFSSRAHPGT